MLQVFVIAPLVAPEPVALVISKDITVGYIDYEALCKIHMGKLETLQDVVKLIQCLHNEPGQLEDMFQVIQVIDKKNSNLNCRSKYSCS